MAYHVIVARAVSRYIGTCGLSRNGVVRLLARLHDELSNEADQFRGDRAPDDPDYFRYRIDLADRGQWHTCNFAVNDRVAPGFLFVEDMFHQSRPGGG